jgi:predicted house-cleaning NTP pyrophosphatase (Maf/HAM1 superfamily)
LGLKDFTIRVSTFEEDLPKAQFRRRAAAYAVSTALHKALDVTRMECAEIAAAATEAAAGGVSGVTPTASVRALSSFSDEDNSGRGGGNGGSGGKDSLLALPPSLLALPDLVVSADTVVESPAGDILEKPESDAHHAQMLRALSGAAHRVHTGVALVLPRPAEAAVEALRRRQPQEQQAVPGEGLTGPCLHETRLTPEGWVVRSFAVTTRVRFAPLSDAAIDAYVRSGDGAGKAGGYGIQGRASAFVEELCGDYFSVVGFPLHSFSAEVCALIEQRALDLYPGLGGGGGGGELAAVAAAAAAKRGV